MVGTPGDIPAGGSGHSVAMCPEGYIPLSGWHVVWPPATRTQVLQDRPEQRTFDPDDGFGGWLVQLLNTDTGTASVTTSVMCALVG